MSSGNRVHKTNKWKFYVRKTINVKWSKTRHSLFSVSPPIKGNIFRKCISMSVWIVPPTIYSHTYIHTYVYYIICLYRGACIHISGAVKILPSLRQNSRGHSPIKLSVPGLHFLIDNFRVSFITCQLQTHTHFFLLDDVASVIQPCFWHIAACSTKNISSEAQLNRG